MIISFFHDAIIYSDEKEFYSTILSYSVWKRYLSVCNKLIVSTRQKKLEESEKNHKNQYNLSSGKNVLFMPINSYNSVIDSFLNKNKIKREVRNALEASDCAIIRLPSVIGNFAYKEAIKLGKPYAVEVVGCAWDAYWNHSMQGKILALNLFLNTRYGIKHALQALYVTHKFLQRRYPCNNTTIGGCSNVMIIEQSEDVLNERLEKIEKFNKCDEIIIGLIGSLDVGYKGHKTAINALKILNDKGYENITLRFLGGGNKRAWETMARRLGVLNKVEFCGTLPSGNRVLSWMNSLDLLIVPSYTEGLPRVVIEAMSIGCPIIGSNAGGIPELIDGEFIHRKKKSKELAEKIINMVENKNLMKASAKTNFINAKEYSEDILNKSRTRFLNQFIDSIKDGKQDKDRGAICD